MIYSEIDLRCDMFQTLKTQKNIGGRTMSVEPTPRELGMI